MQEQHLALKMTPSKKRLKPVGDPSMESNRQKSELFSDTHHRHHHGERRITCKQLDNIVLTTNTHQNLLGKVVINSQLLNMQQPQG
jgi:hypothetical protein